MELKIPPPLVALALGVAMWFVAQLPPQPSLGLRWRVALAALPALAGFALAVAGVRAFRRAGTTVHPMKPQETTALVTSGVFRYTRNPMYLGVLLLLLAWSIALLSPWALVGPVGFLAYITRFQIVPEERELARKFGGDYDRYRAWVRRWL
ncbi:MAG: isoprenylcysteine carboxylmethyltransferase family protein [Gammaproteobacteria bacterium]|nr:isoprenylcysteine carboxylmethyltransferase family protein [Gammaproteobacteria bacterium]